MIIGITGLKGCGKDTVAKLLQYHFAQSNVKEYLHFGNYMSSVYKVNDISDISGWEVRKFAGKLKQIICILTGCSMEQLEDEEFKNSNVLEILGEEPKSYRWLLQKLGTEAIRDNIHKEIWVNSLFADYKRPYDVAIEKTGGYTNSPYPMDYPNWIISDLRFLNEAKAIKDRDGIILRVTRFSNNSFDEHRSETELYNIIPDYEIGNNGCIEELYDMVKMFINEYKLIK